MIRSALLLAAAASVGAALGVAFRRALAERPLLLGGTLTGPTSSGSGVVTREQFEGARRSAGGGDLTPEGVAQFERDWAAMTFGGGSSGVNTLRRVTFTADERGFVKPGDFTLREHVHLLGERSPPGEPWVFKVDHTETPVFSFPDGTTVAVEGVHASGAEPSIPTSAEPTYTETGALAITPGQPVPDTRSEPDGDS